ncbi:glycosyltransferase family 2 protein [Algoriphagus yeomjeoni]|uniref:Glycosyltransferase involved in cell wall biosynthesis n=1 Tax=Algoriphagus yeomjeoni TaxID=291403 RepID=A0A327PK46_9BACT|nr:glycosyltransferase family 2 protein [Algoriphagus yeomjeoni]RAI91953.1 glycosyltransferase involved in cell wall biosynthesis [Algoriphagus yeomjeoni]
MQFFYGVEYLGGNKRINIIQPLVSVCVPTFQHYQYIQKCLDSILSQRTNFTYEIIIGEDDSSDGTKDICLSYAELNQDKIRLFLRRDEDKMIRNGRKTGRLNHLALYQSARGKYVCICDGDDYWVNEQKLQLQVDFMEKYPTASLCITDTDIKGGLVSRPADLPEKFHVFSPYELRKKNYFGHISSWMMRNEMEELLNNRIVLKTEIIDMVVFTFYKNRGDTIFIPIVTSVYNLNPNGIFRGRSSLENWKTMVTMNWHLFYFLHNDPVQLTRSFLYSLRRFFVNFLK